MKSYQNIVAITKRFYLFVIAFFVSLQSLKAQINLVPNSSFETYITCPSAYFGNPPPDPWYLNCSKTIKKSYFNGCAAMSDLTSVPYNYPIGSLNYQQAYTGSGYIILVYYPNDRNYIQTKLIDSLKINHFYYVKYFTNLPNTIAMACNNNGLLLTKKAFYVDTLSNPYAIYPANPQIVNYGNPIITDTMSWVKVSGIYKAQGGEQFITIGNFKTDAQTTVVNVNPAGEYVCGYIIDDVSVIPLDSFNLLADAGADKIITIGDSVFIGSYTNGIDSLKWLNQNTGNKIDSTRPGFWVHPLVNTCYVLTQTVNGFTSSDTVCITVKPLPLKFISFSIFPSNGGVRGGFTTANEINVSHYNILRSINGKDFTLVDKVKANNKNYNEYSFTDSPPVEGVGVGFYYRIQSIDKDGKISYSETRTVDNKKMVEGVIVYPNPAKDYIAINGKLIKEVSVTSIDGRVMLKQQCSNVYSTTINIKNLVAGLYIVKTIDSKGVIITNKLIKQ